MVAVCGTWIRRRNWIRTASGAIWGRLSRSTAKWRNASACRCSRKKAGPKAGSFAPGKPELLLHHVGAFRGCVFCRVDSEFVIYFFMSLAVSLASVAEPLASIAELLASVAASVALSADFMASGAGAGAGAGVTITGAGGGGGGAGLSHATRSATTATAAKTDLFMVFPLLKLDRHVA